MTAPAANAAANAATAIAAPPILFALAPGLHGQDIINFGDAYGSRLFKDATMPLYTTGEKNFDGKSEQLHNFTIRGTSRAANFGWACIHEVPEDIADPLNDLVSIWTHYGLITME